jgi:hypothetical protein
VQRQTELAAIGDLDARLRRSRQLCEGAPHLLRRRSLSSRGVSIDWITSLSTMT